MEKTNRERAEALIKAAQGPYDSNALDIARKTMLWQAAGAYAQMAILDELDKLARR